MKKNHGGIRQGAGRPSTFGEPTKPIRLPTRLIESVQQFVAHQCYHLPLYDHNVSAGTPASVDNAAAENVNLVDHLIKNPASTFLVRAVGDSMINAGIHDNDLLIVDRKIKPSAGKIVIAAVDGQLTVKRLWHSQDGKILLVPENLNYTAIEISEEQQIIIWGVVTKVIHSV